MDSVDQKQQTEIQSLQGQDRVHTLILKFIGVGLVALFLVIFVLLHLVLTQKIYIENYPRSEQSK